MKYKRLLYNIFYNDLEIKDALLDYNCAAKSLSIRWRSEEDGWFDKELYFSFAIIDNLTANHIMFLVTPKIGEQLNNLFCYFNKLEE